jgi:hypothetical protein
MTTSLTHRRIAAAARITEAERTRAGEVALIPGDEDNGIASPGGRVHNLIDCVPQESITCGDQALDIIEVTWVGRRAASSVHIMALVGANPGIIRHGIVRQVVGESLKAGDILHAFRITLHIQVRDKRIVLALVQLIPAGSRQQIAVAERQRLHIRLPALAMSGKLIDDIRDINRHRAITGDAVERTGGRRDVVGLAGMSDTGVVPLQPHFFSRRWVQERWALSKI